MEENEVNGLMGLLGVGDVMLDEAIGAIQRRFPNASPRSQVRMATAKVVADSALTSTATRGQRLILANLKKFPLEIQKSVSEGRAKMNDLHLYVRKNIANGAGGTIELINETNQKKAGITNIDKNRIEENLVALVTGIRVTSAAHATTTDPSAVGYSNVQAIGTAATNVPVGLINAELIIRKGGNVIFTAPMSKFYNPGGAYASIPGQFDTYQLNNAMLFDSGETINIDVKFPEGSTLPIANNFVQVELLGVGIRG